MSENWITLIPTDPDYVPSVEVGETARKLFEGFVPDAREIRAEVSDQIEFHTGNGNWSGVLCPVCGSDIETWFFDRVDEKYVDRWKYLAVVTLCCGSKLSLNDMNFIWPAGFSRFALEARDPNVYDLEPAQIQALEEILGCKLRRIWVHI